MRETLPLNIVNNEHLESLQFVILNYNSSDGLGEWMKQKMLPQINTGKIVYFETFQPEYFHRSLARNLAFSLADGEILCNIDADNYTGEGFADFVYNTFQFNENIFLSTIDTTNKANSDVYGRICCTKTDFQKVGGYDERIEEYGFEDYDLVNRLELSGARKMIISNPIFLKAIQHGDTERLINEKSFRTVYKIYIRCISYMKTEILILFKDGTINMGKLIDCNSILSTKVKYAIHPIEKEYEFTLQEKNWITGKWEFSENGILILFENDTKLRLHDNRKGHLKFERWEYHQILSPDLINQIMLFRSQFINRNIMKENKILEWHSSQNDLQKGIILFKNFDYSSPYQL